MRRPANACYAESMQRARAFGLCEWTPRIFLAVALTMIVTGSFAPANVRAAPNGTSARGFLGVRTEPATGGLRIVEVISSSPAERAGLAVDDLIVRINRFPAHTYDELVQVVSVTGPGGSITPSVMCLNVRPFFVMSVEYG